MSLVVRAVSDMDGPALLALNDANVAELAPLDAGRLRELLSVAALATAIGPDGQPDGFLLAFDQMMPAQGPNHAFFLRRHSRLLYVDRVCVAPSARRRGVARALYAHALDHAARIGTPVLCCEVNSEPPNPVSDAFHAALGFREVGTAFLSDRAKTVRYLERAVDLRRF